MATRIRGWAVSTPGRRASEESAGRRQGGRRGHAIILVGIQDGDHESEQAEQEEAGQERHQEPRRELGSAAVDGSVAHLVGAPLLAFVDGRRTEHVSVGLADPTGFEPAISSVTGWHVGPLHHGSRGEGD